MGVFEEVELESMMLVEFKSMMLRGIVERNKMIMNVVLFVVNSLGQETGQTIGFNWANPRV